MSLESEDLSPQSVLCAPTWVRSLVTDPNNSHPLRRKFDDLLINTPLFECWCPGNALIDPKIARTIKGPRKSILRCPTFTQRYKLITKIADGGFGQAWVAKVLDKARVKPGIEYVVAKLQNLFPQTGEIEYSDVHRIPGHGLVASEALAQSLVTPHPNLPSIIEAYVHRACFAIVMNLVASNTDNLPASSKSCTGDNLVEYTRLEETLHAKQVSAEPSMLLHTGF
jgi:hypothetical protein